MTPRASALFLSIAIGMATYADDELLVVFVQPDASDVARHFNRHQLPVVRKLADERGIKFRVRDARDGCPTAVGITPLLVYQNHRGRSIYQGRYTTLSRIEMFLRTARYVPQEKRALQRHSILVKQDGRSRIAVPIKVTSLRGTPPTGYDRDRFTATATAAIRAALTEYNWHDTVSLDRADRLFYMDLYPASNDGHTLQLRYALYSQFHCEKPIYSAPATLTALWSERTKLIQTAARHMAAAIEHARADPEKGDGCVAVPLTTPVVDWSELDMPLPSPPATTTLHPPPDTQPTQRWRLATTEAQSRPRVQFRFPAPLDGYRGEARTVRGRLNLHSGQSDQQRHGFFEVDVRSLSMGDDDLDDAIQGRIFLNSDQYPTSRFDVTRIDTDGEPLKFGQLSRVTLTGAFTLKGKTLPLTVLAELEPTIADDGSPRLVMQTAFGIDLRTFDIAEADGPAPARHTMLYDIYFVLEPSDEAL